MANPYALTGAAQGLAAAEEKHRRRKIEDEDRGLAKEDRTRQIRRQDESDSQSRVKFGLDISQNAEDREYLQGERGYQQKQRGLAEAEHTEDRAFQKGERTYQTEKRAKTDKRQATIENRQDFEWNTSREALAKKMHEEGMSDMIHALEAGVDPSQAEGLFNKGGEFGIQPGTLRHDKATDRVQFVGKGGQAFDGTLKQLKSLFGGGDKLTKVKNDERLVNAKGQTVVPAAAGNTAGARKTAAWNEQTASKNASQVVADDMGLKFDSQLNRYLIPEGMSRKVSVGSALAGQVVRAFGPRITDQEAGAIAAEAVRGISTAEDAEKAARAKLGAKADEQSVRAEQDAIMERQRIEAAQKLNSLMRRKEMEIAQREEAAAAAGEAGGDGLAAASAQPQPGAGPVPAAPATAAPKAAPTTRRVYDATTRSFN